MESGVCSGRLKLNELDHIIDPDSTGHPTPAKTAALPLLFPVDLLRRIAGFQKPEAADCKKVLCGYTGKQALTKCVQSDCDSIHSAELSWPAFIVATPTADAIL